MDCDAVKLFVHEDKNVINRAVQFHNNTKEIKNQKWDFESNTAVDKKQITLHQYKRHICFNTLRYHQNQKGFCHCRKNYIHYKV